MNSLNYNVTKTNINTLERVDVHIRLDDECNNGHQDFSITSEYYKGKKDSKGEISWGFYSCGSNHDNILRIAPEFKIFVDLHLSNYLGQPMYFIENGFYFMKNYDDKVAQKHFRIADDDVYEQLKSNSIDEEILLYNLIKMGIIDQWENEAKMAIKLLENLTGNTFTVDSNPQKVFIKSNYDFKPTEQKIVGGFYDTKSIKERQRIEEVEKYSRALNELREQRDTLIENAKREFSIKYIILDTVGLKSNFIYYNHDNTIKFNWLKLSSLFTEDEIKQCMDKLTPLGITLK